jgi:hypothetical protein
MHRARAALPRGFDSLPSLDQDRGPATRRGVIIGRARGARVAVDHHTIFKIVW